MDRAKRIAGARSVTFDQATYTSLLAMASVYDASNPDLRAFRDHGGKLILYHGWSDPAIPPNGTLEYYAAVQEQMGGLQATQSFARLFMLPGVYHCQGGDGPSHFDTLTAIVNWVEGGVAPTEIIATQYDTDNQSSGGTFSNPGSPTTQGTPTASTGVSATSAAAGGGGAPSGSGGPGGAQTTTGNPVRTLPAFAYPQYPRYTGTGSVNDAQNYVPSTAPRDQFPWIGQSVLSPSTP